MTDGTGAHIGLVGAGRIGAMHARNLATLPGVGRITVTDADGARARAVADRTGAGVAANVPALLRAGLDGLVIAAATAAHPELIAAGVDAGIPVFCEKPVAPDVASARPVMAYVAARDGVVQIGHQRRFDPGYREARRAYRAGELGRLHGFRAVTCDREPPPVSFIATSGGLFRDCGVHDFDVIRWITGREIAEVYARGSNNGDPAIGAAGDVDTAVAVCVLDDGTVGTVAVSRYNGAGYDVRLELQGSAGSVVAGLDDHSALRSAERGVAFPAGAPHPAFAERFAVAYREEMAAFLRLARGDQDNPCAIGEAVAAARPATRRVRWATCWRGCLACPFPS